MLRPLVLCLAVSACGPLDGPVGTSVEPLRISPRACLVGDGAQYACDRCWTWCAPREVWATILRADESMTVGACEAAITNEDGATAVGWYHDATQAALSCGW